MYSDWQTIDVAEINILCPKCKKNLINQLRPINVQVWWCKHCQEGFDPLFVEGYWKGYGAREHPLNADVANRPENIDANLLNRLISHLEHLKKVYVVPNDNYGPDVDILQEWIDWLNRHAG